MRTGLDDSKYLALALACAALLYCENSPASTETVSCEEFQPFDESNIPSTEKIKELCQYNENASADKHLVNKGNVCLNWSACEQQYKTTIEHIQSYNAAVKNHCRSIEQYKLTNGMTGQDKNFKEAQGLFEKIQAEKKELAAKADLLAIQIAESMKYNEETIAKYKRDQEKLNALKACVQKYTYGTEVSKEAWSCAKWNKRAAFQFRGEKEVVKLQNGEIDTENGGSRSWAEYHSRMKRLIAEQESAMKFASTSIQQLRRNAAVQRNSVNLLDGNIASVKESGTNTGSLGEKIATGNQALALGNNLTALGNRNGNSGSGSRISSGSSSMPTPQNLTASNNLEGKNIDPISAAVNSVFDRLGRDSIEEKTKELRDPLIAGDVGGKAGSEQEVNSGVADSGGARVTNGSAGISGGGAPEGARTLAGYAAEKKQNEKGSSSGASRLSKDDGVLNQSPGGGSSAPASGSNFEEMEEETELLSNFSGEIRNQQDGLEEQSEIASILDQMQDMFSEMPGEGEPGVNASTTPATNGLSRSDEIARFEKFEAKGGVQGATMAHQSEELMNFSLFSRVHLRHRKSMEKGLVIFGLRHRVE